MAETLTTLAGEVLDTDRTEAAFAAAMAAPAADRPGVAAPARKPPEPDPDPETAPHGWTYVEGQWRPKKHPGRPRTANGDRPRVTEAKDAPRPASATSTGSPRPPATPAGAPAPAANYTKVLNETAEGLWFVLAGIPVPETAFGYKLGNLRRNLRVQAAIVQQHTPGLVAGMNLIGQHNRFMARALDRLQKGESGLWILPACLALAPMLAATGQLWSGQLAGAGLDLDAVAAQTEAQHAQYLAAMAGDVAATIITEGAP